MISAATGDTMDADSTTPSSTSAIKLSTSSYNSDHESPAVINHRSTTTNRRHAATMLHFDDLRFVQRLGRGDIGSVYLVEIKSPAELEGCMFAAKVMDKEELMSRNKEGRARVEREVLEVLEHPFLPSLYARLEAEKWSCYLTEFCPGGDLHFLRQRQPERRFNEATVRFYASEVVVALEYLHLKGIIYRDLKPENVLVRSDGHILLTDFDLCLKCDDSTTTLQVIPDRNQFMKSPSPSCMKNIKSFTSPITSCILPSCIMSKFPCNKAKRHKRRRKPNNHHRATSHLDIIAEPTDARSMSFVGTHEYLAPEIVSGEGHGNSVDWWTLGIFIFELFYGVTPFKGNDNDFTLASIVARGLEFPEEPAASGPMKDLITKLLIKDPAKRMGSTMGATAVKHHPFFDGVNWALLRCTPPPYIPRPVTFRDFVARQDTHDVSDIEYY